MTILDVLVYPDPRLRTVAKPVEKVDDAIRQLVKDMAETMYDENGIGLAATQVNVHKQVVVMDLSESGDDILVLINPSITEKDGEQKYDEGCLSVPEVYAPIKRAASIKVTALNELGEEFELQANGLQAVCIQHELDHLKGIMFVDYLSRMKQERIKKKMIKRQKAG